MAIGKQLYKWLILLQMVKIFWQIVDILNYTLNWNGKVIIWYDPYNIFISIFASNHISNHSAHIDWGKEFVRAISMTENAHYLGGRW